MKIGIGLVIWGGLALISSTKEALKHGKIKEEEKYNVWISLLSNFLALLLMNYLIVPHW